MSERKAPLVTDQLYHVFNRSLNREIIFVNSWNFSRYLKLIDYYRNTHQPVSLSRLLQLNKKLREEILHSLQKDNLLRVDILAYCIMPTHYHFILRQVADDGITKFIRDTSNSYGKYFNKKSERYGPVFQGRFKAVRIESDEQLLHVVRYVHLNPYSSFIVKNLDEVLKYPYSSMHEYMNAKPSFVSKELVLELHNGIEQMIRFTLNQANYQQTLSSIKHFTYS